MQLIKISLLALLSSYAAAQDFDNDDVPNECRSICQPVVQLTRTCDSQNDDDGPGYINCVCSFNNAATLIPVCEACVANYDRDDGRDNDVNDLIRSCSFTATSFVSGAGTSAISTGSSTGSGSITTTSLSTSTTTLSDGRESTTTGTSTGVVAQSTGAGSNGATTTGSGASPSNIGNAAGGLSADIGVAAMGFLAGLVALGLA